MSDFDFSGINIEDHLHLLPINDNKKFYIGNQRLFLTYRSHIPKQDLREFFHNFSKHTPVEIEIAHESADKAHPYPHTHVFLDFGKRFQSTKARIFDFKGIHPHIKKVINRKHVTNIYRYLTKEDPENSHLRQKFEKPSLAESVWKCTSKTDVIKMAKHPSEVSGLLAIHQNKPTSTSDFNIEFVRWQYFLEKELDRTVDPRKIIWYIDLVGNTRKSYYCKYRAIAHNDLILTQLASERDVATIVKNAIENSWNGKAVLVDLPRDDKHNHSIYKPLEMIKNGMITASKYQGGTVIFDNPHVVVFANFHPTLSSLSRDRWDIRDITPNTSSQASSSQPIHNIYTTIPNPHAPINT